MILLQPLKLTRCSLSQTHSQIDVQVNSPESGTVVEHFAKEGDTVSVGGNLFSLELGEAPAGGSAPPIVKKEEPKPAPLSAPKGAASPAPASPASPASQPSPPLGTQAPKAPQASQPPTSLASVKVDPLTFGNRLERRVRSFAKLTC